MTMIKHIVPLLLLLFLLNNPLPAQKSDTTRRSLNHYSLAIGFGWAHYINSLEIGKAEATIDHPGISLKFYWEPEHRLSLGLESGYYRIFGMTREIDNEQSGKVTLSAIPLLLNVRMRIVDHFYLSAGAGLALMLNRVSGINQTINSTILSLSNYQFSASYLYPLNRYWIIGGEFKFLNFGKTDDWIYSLQACCAIRL